MKYNKYILFAGSKNHSRPGMDSIIDSFHSQLEAIKHWAENKVMEELDWMQVVDRDTWEIAESQQV